MNRLRPLAALLLILAAPAASAQVWLFDGPLSTQFEEGRWVTSGNGPGDAFSPEGGLFRFALDQSMENVFRSELSQDQPTRLELDTRYQLIIEYLVPSDWVFNDEWTTVFQLHGTPDFDLNEDGRSPILFLAIVGRQWLVGVRASGAELTPPVGTLGRFDVDIRAYPFDVEPGGLVAWKFDFHTRFDREGYAHVSYRNIAQGEPFRRVLVHNGAVAYNDEVGPYVKVGIYPALRKFATEPLPLRELFVRRVRLKLVE